MEEKDCNGCIGFCTPEPLWKYDSGGGSILK